MPTSSDPPRNDTKTIACPICGATTTRTGRRRYCSNACRQAAWRRRNLTPQHVPLPPTRSRRENTIYQCDECDTRYLAEQWCYDCNRPARRIGPGGACSCGELLTINELLDAPP